MTKVILVSFLMLPMASLLALDRSVYGPLEGELKALVDGAGDVWAYSGNGGYAFKFEKDVSGGPEEELFVNFSLRPNVWHVFSAGDNKTLLGQVEFPSFDFIHSKKEHGQTRILRSYSADSYAAPPFEPFGKYVLEQVITESGVDSKVRKVGVEATEREFNDLRLGTESTSVKWANPALQAVMLKDLLLQPNEKWFDFDPDKAQVRNGYYRLPGDEPRISAFEGTFTPRVALKALNQSLGVSRPDKDDAASTSGSPVRSTATPVMSSPAGGKDSAPQPKTSPSPVTVEAESSHGFPILPVAIAGAIILVILIFVLRGKST